MTNITSEIINEKEIAEVLAKNTSEDSTHIREVLAKALELKGLDGNDVAVLMAAKDPDILAEIFVTARKVKEEIYGSRLVIFAPLYISNFCSNNCLYCAFRSGNTQVKRRFLSSDEIAHETLQLINQGHKRIVMLAGESYPGNDFQYALDAIEKIYSVRSDHGAIRRINVELAPLTVEEFKRLKQAQIGTFIMFQETYHRDTYKKVHLAGKKTDYDWRLTAMDRAMSADIDDVGFGALFGLCDWRFEVLGLLQHANHLQKQFGVGPHTISVPRLEAALGSELSANPIAPVSDVDFCKIVAILRLAVPYTGIIMSTRETPEIRRLTLALGVSQISAGSRTDPGGYSESKPSDGGQFSLGDHRSLEEVVQDVASLGYIPSFCTACYRSGRTGEDFMCLARPGDIKEICAPNALVTFEEYLLDYASPKTREVGEKLIATELEKMPAGQQNVTKKMLSQLQSGKRDVFV